MKGSVQPRWQFHTHPLQCVALCGNVHKRVKKIIKLRETQTECRSITEEEVSTFLSLSKLWPVE